MKNVKILLDGMSARLIQMVSLHKSGMMKSNTTNRWQAITEFSLKLSKKLTCQKGHTVSHMTTEEACQRIYAIVHNMQLEYSEHIDSADYIAEDLEETIMLFQEIHDQIKPVPKNSLT